MLSACTQPVRVDGSWGEGVPRDQSFSKVLVVGVSPDVNQRCAFEEDLANNLREASVVARASCRELGVKEPLTRENIERAVASFGADAVLATRLVQAGMGLAEGGTTETRGDAYYKPIGYGYETGYWGAYGVPVVYGAFQTAPSVISLQGTATIVSTLFETRGATPVYIVETRAQGFESREQGLTLVTPAIAERLVRAGVVR